MKLSHLLASAAMMLAMAACSNADHTTYVTWETLGNQTDETGDYFVQRITITGDTDFDRLAFNQFKRKMQAVDPADTIIELLPGYYCIASPRFREAKGDTVIVDIRTDGHLRWICYGPDGFHRVNADGTTSPVEFTLLSITSRPEQYSTPDVDYMPKAEDIYAFNEQLLNAPKAGDYDVIPSFKHVEIIPGQSNVASLALVEKPNDKADGESMTITVANDTVLVEAAPAYMKSARQRALNLMRGFAGPTVANAVINDKPDFGYRAVMVDISRNFQTPAEMNRILDMLARYGFNVMHFHFSDDDAWRVDIPELPELVEVGAHRGYTLDEHDFIAQIHAGDGNPNSTVGTANGYFTQEDFIGMLRHADSLGIKVLPEVESPGHARAAIKAMENRYRKTGDASMRLIEDGDTSVYISAQTFYDNVLNPALESTYTFLEKVYDGIIDMYDRAGVELPAIHIGGDEVPRGAWSGAPSVIKYKAEHGIESDHDMHGVFNKRVCEYLASKGVKVSGWQEVVCDRDKKYHSTVAPNTFTVNSWTNATMRPDAPSRQALDGNYPLVLSNVDRFYLDMNASYHPDERGLTWSTPVDEFVSLGGYPENLLVMKPGDRDKIVGLSGQIFSETVRSPQDLEMRLLPKMLGLAERAWNSTPTYENPTFNAVIYGHEIPIWEAGGYNYHVRQPGVVIADSNVTMNAAYPGIGEIHYTLDGSTPTPESPVYNGAFVLPSDTKQIRAIYTVNGKSSVATIVWL